MDLAALDAFPWDGAVQVGSLVLGVVGTALTWLATRARRRLLYGITGSGQVTADDLERQAQIAPERRADLEGRYLTVLDLQARGPRDIRAADFDDGKWLVFDVGSPALHVTSLSSGRGRPFPTVAVDGALVGIAPTLLARGQHLSLLLLTDDQVGQPTCVQNPLVDVDLVNEHPKKRRPKRLWLAVMAGNGLVGLGVGLVFASLSESLSFWPLNVLAFVVSVIQTQLASSLLRVPKAFRFRRHSGDELRWFSSEDLADGADDG